MGQVWIFFISLIDHLSRKDGYKTSTLHGNQNKKSRSSRPSTPPRVQSEQRHNWNEKNNGDMHASNVLNNTLALSLCLPFSLYLHSESKLHFSSILVVIYLPFNSVQRGLDFMSSLS